MNETITQFQKDRTQKLLTPFPDHVKFLFKNKTLEELCNFYPVHIQQQLKLRKFKEKIIQISGSRMKGKSVLCALLGVLMLDDMPLTATYFSYRTIPLHDEFLSIFDIVLATGFLRDSIDTIAKDRADLGKITIVDGYDPIKGALELKL